jgi:hypothetical protein
LSEQGAVPVPQEVLEGLEALRRHTHTDMLDIATARYLAMERGQAAVVVWIDAHPEHTVRAGSPRRLPSGALTPPGAGRAKPLPLYAGASLCRMLWIWTTDNSTLL